MRASLRIGNFEWDPRKNNENIHKHRIGFEEAMLAFDDPNSIFQDDAAHSQGEKRFFCIGKVGARILTVRFTRRGNQVRILGAGVWRKGIRSYEKEIEEKATSSDHG